ncbi:MAG TPA: CDP-glucose 4,6-dehydratase, partial [Bacteroidia bacterium]|nr:CDP-glucose 4,6-dehydratase [Bacteroidia bacterium]
SYKRSFLGNKGLLLATARAGNVIGGGDWGQDRLIPDIVKATSKKKKTLIRNPKSIRPWQHVLEPLSGYLLLGQKLLERKDAFADAWNFGPDKDQCLNVNAVLTLLKKEWKDIEIKYAQEAKNNPHEAAILMLDHSKATKQLKWQPVWKMNKTITKTANWYKAYYNTGKLFTAADLKEYVVDAKNKKVIWAK